MSNLAIGLFGVIVLLVVLLVRVPIGVALALVGVSGYAAIDGWGTALTMLGAVPFELASAYSLSVVPLFILMGALASRAGMSRELFDAANAIFSGFRGALTNATIGACAAFGAICGSSIATAATFSKVAIPEMRRHGYDEGLAAGSVAAAGTLGILIPPSVILAIYSLVAEQSLAKLFAAALFPGLLLAAFYILVVVALVRMRPAWTPKVPAMAVGERLRAALYMWKLALLFFLAVVGIYLGWFSPTEAAAIAAFAAALIGFATGTLSVRGFLDALLDTVYSTAMIFFIIVGAFIFSRFIVLTRLPNELVAWVQQAGLAPFWIVLAVIMLYFLLGTFLEEVSTILVTVPVILPLMTSIGYDGIWFGIFVTIMATIGLISPPVGLTVFVIQAQNPDIPAGKIYRGTLPFLAADFVLIAVLIAFPALALWLPAALRM
ncbi:MAG: C4-dicarboxylate ABC transporter permease [Betaproteobacteria bacterium RIFCSPLOWO2_12_FULL_65_14]|nr:MAG: C4-dicarboxylate ABC transporter permease [Betaproteobacteria bacterium RIFCSPLOWO2_12_FULL_65_14]